MLASSGFAKEILVFMPLLPLARLALTAAILPVLPGSLIGLPGATPPALSDAADPAATSNVASALATFPYRHASVVPAGQAFGNRAPQGTLWVSLDDGTASPRTSMSKAVPANGEALRSPAYTDPTRCDVVNGQVGTCLRYIQRVGEDVRVWTTYQGTSCVLIARLDNAPTILNCDGVSTTV